MMLPPVNHLRTSKGKYLLYCNQSYKTEVSQVIIKNIQWQISSIIRWLHEIDQNCDVVNRILVGNKNDDPDRKVVLSEDARRFAHQMGIQVLKMAAPLTYPFDLIRIEYSTIMTWILYPVIAFWNVCQRKY